ncbi:MAG: HEPN domain-containing protein [Deltaproteobacteria bacterium]|nr:HEPN domain-containing protein [Deltaproteobacteria bacterium]
MKKEDIKKIVKYWQKTAEHDYEVMLCLFKGKKYSDSLFFGHIVLEKILKGLVVEETKKEAPKTHDLVRLAEITKLELPSKTLEYLKIVNRFNMRTRYPDAKLEFYKCCDLEYTKNNLEKIKKLYKKLCQKLKQKK